MGTFSAMHWIVVAIIFVLLFGRRLPEVGSGLGKAISNFRKSYKDGMAIDVTPDEESTERSSSTHAASNQESTKGGSNGKKGAE